MSEYSSDVHVHSDEEAGGSKECLRKENFYLKEALREMRDHCRDLEQQLYDIQMAVKKDRLARLPKPNLREASEMTRTDFFKGVSLPAGSEGEACGS